MNSDYKWFAESGPVEDVVVSSRVRLARNIRGFPFMGRITPAQRSELLGRIAGAAGRDYDFIDMQSLSPVMRGVMYEWHLISPEFAEGDKPRALLLDKAGVSIMACEEDHIRIQALSPGLNLGECRKLAEDADKKLGAKLPYAFDEKLGYLTHCPTNLGTGMRVSAMLHLPAMTATGTLRSFVPQLSKLGVTVRGMYGEGTDQAGNLFQLSNQVTLGISEENTVNKLQNIIEQVIRQEKDLRSRMMQADPTAVEDKVWRSYGVLTNARQMSSAEFMALISDVRLGASLGIIEGIPLSAINALIFEAQPSGVQAQLAAEDADAGGERARDRERAAIIRGKLLKQPV